MYARHYRTMNRLLLQHLPANSLMVFEYFTWLFTNLSFSWFSYRFSIVMFYSDFIFVCWICVGGCFFSACILFRFFHAISCSQCPVCCWLLSLSISLICIYIVVYNSYVIISKVSHKLYLIKLSKTSKTKIPHILISVYFIGQVCYRSFNNNKRNERVAV